MSDFRDQKLEYRLQ